MDSRYDMVIFGATGFTGKHMLEPAHKACQEKGLTVAVAGRSRQKLQATLEEVQTRTKLEVTKFPIIVADVSDEASLKEMTKKAKVLINCCGPFTLYGEQVVRVCISTGTSYVDITAEPVFMNRVLLKYNDLAKKRGVYIVPACGLDCLPSDLGVVYLQDNFPGTLNSVEIYVELFRGGLSRGSQFNTGTWESLVTHLGDLWEHMKLKNETKPKHLPSLKPKPKMRLLPHTQPTLNRPSMFFPSADVACIEKTQAYLHEHDNKRPVQANMYFSLESYFQLFVVVLGCAIWIILSQISITRNLLIKYPKFFTYGFFDANQQPSEEEIEKWEFCATMFGEGWKHKSTDPSDQFTSKLDQRIIGRVKCYKNAGYESTAIMTVMCARMLLNERNKLPKVGGVYTTGAAFAKTSIIKQLIRNGITFEILSIPTSVK